MKVSSILRFEFSDAEGNAAHVFANKFTGFSGVHFRVSLSDTFRNIPLTCITPASESDAIALARQHIAVMSAYLIPAARQSSAVPHADDCAIDAFAVEMKARMAQKRAEGRGGWQNPMQCSVERLRSLLENTPVGSPVDIGNYAMMLFTRADNRTEKE